MPRDGSNIYSVPVGTQAVSTTAISSSNYNALLSDLEAIANEARPITAGGTGQSSVTGVQGAFKIAPTDGNATITGDWTFSGAVDLTGATVSGGILVPANNLSDVLDAAVSRQNLGLQIGQDVQGFSDLLKNISTDIAFAQGDILYHNGSGLVKLPKGAANEALTMNDAETAPEWRGGGWQFAAIQVPVGGETQFDFTGIPANVNEICVHAEALDPGSQRNRIQFGTSGGIVDTGYYGSAGAYFGNATTGVSIATNFPVLTYAVGVKAGCSYRFTRISGNKWAGGGTHGREGGSDNGTLQGGVDLGAALTQVRISVSSGTYGSGGQVVVGWRF